MNNGYGIFTKPATAGVAPTYSTSVNGADSTTVTVAGLIGKTIISVFTDGILRNSNAGVGPVDYIFNAGTGVFTFSSTVYADQIISIIYK